MIFKGKTPQERSRENNALIANCERNFSSKKEKLRHQWDAECKWHRWFALFCVDVGSYNEPQTAWLQFVERRIRFRDEMPRTSASWSFRAFKYRKITEPARY